MNNEKLVWIKARQKEYQELFGERLEVNFSVMNNEEIEMSSGVLCKEDVEEWINTQCTKRGISLDTIKTTKRIYRTTNSKEYKFLRDFGMFTRINKVPAILAGQCIGRCKSVVEHYQNHAKEKE